jgi:hypothetical protein
MVTLCYILYFREILLSKFELQPLRCKFRCLINPIRYELQFYHDGRKIDVSSATVVDLLRAWSESAV